jgi:glycogen debranching enzyme
VAPRVVLTPGERRRIADEARAVLERNRRRGISKWDGRRFDFVCPSPTHYPFQWLWDSCFHAIALCHVDPLLAQRELRGVLAAAQPDGFIPHMTLWERDAHLEALSGFNIRYGGPYWTATTQPPVLAQAIERVFEASGDRDFLREVLPVTRAYYDWLARERDPDQDGLISILQPDESGLDASPKYDALLQLPSLNPSGLRFAMQRLFAAYEPLRSDRDRLLRGLFDVEDVMVNSIYAQGLAALSRLTAEVGAEASESARLASQADAVSRTLVDHCWDADAGAFWDLAGAEHRQQRVLTITSLFPLILPALPRAIAEALVHRHVLNPREFWLTWPIPSVAASEPTFDHGFATGIIWRGPTWINTNWFLVHGLRQHGFHSAAAQLTDRSLALIVNSGYREHFNPLTGDGYGATSFGWSTLTLDLLADV